MKQISKNKRNWNHLIDVNRRISSLFLLNIKLDTGSNVHNFKDACYATSQRQQNSLRYSCYDFFFFIFLFFFFFFKNRKKNGSSELLNIFIPEQRWSNAVM